MNPIEYAAMNIVHQLGDALYEALPKDIAHEHFVDARQKTNDVSIDFAEKLIDKLLISTIIEFIKKQEGVVEGMKKSTPHDEIAWTFEDGYNQSLYYYKLSLQKEREQWQVLLDNK